MFNTIILKKGYARLTKKEMAKFDQYDTICGADSEAQELQRWPLEQKEEAEAALAKLRCTYEAWSEDLTEICEYALEYCELDEEGEFENGSDFDFAADATKILKNNFDHEISFEDLEKAKRHFAPDLEEFPEAEEYAKEIEDALTLEQLADVLNKYTDTFGNGSAYFVHEI